MTRPAGSGFSWAEDGGAFVATPLQSLVDLGYAPGSPAEPLTLNDGLRQLGLWSQNMAALQPAAGAPRTHSILPASRTFWVRTPSSGTVEVTEQSNGAIKVEYSGGTGAITANLVRIDIGALAGCTRPGADPLLTRLRVRLDGIQAGATNLKAVLLSRSGQIPSPIQVHATTNLSVGTGAQYLVADSSSGSITTPQLDASATGAALFLSIEGDLADTDGSFFIEIVDLDTTNKGIA